MTEFRDTSPEVNCHIRLGVIVSRLRTSSGYMFDLEAPTELSGMQAFAVFDSSTVEVSPELVDALPDDALAWVIAHEVAHLQLDHQKGQKEANRKRVEDFQEGFQRLRDRRKKGEGRFLSHAASGVGLVANLTVGVYLDQRKFEREADLRGVEIAIEAGYDPEGAFIALQTIEGENLVSSYELTRHIANVLQTHPLTEVRINRLKIELARRAAEG